MTPIDRRRLTIACAALGTAGLAYAAEPRCLFDNGQARRLDDLIPWTIGNRRGRRDDELVPATVDGSSLHEQILMRRYDGGGAASVMFIVSYHGATSPDLKVHRPETCYAVAGFHVGPVSPLTLRVDARDEVRAVTFDAQRGDRRESVLYWTRVAERFPQTLLQQRLAFLQEAARGVRPDGLLVRISIVADEAAQARASTVAFARDLLRAASSPARRWLLGASEPT